MNYMNNANKTESRWSVPYILDTGFAAVAAVWACGEEGAVEAAWICLRRDGFDGTAVFGHPSPRQ